ncbi:MAG: T9SS type A sorting domain-containing protein [Calditrichaeota bacterium]|nr:T9SS type A sorting domain-containing protein [Calditrichota bacterium]
MEASKRKAVAIFLMIAIGCMILPGLLSAQEVVTKSQVVTMVHKFIQTNQTKMKFLQGALIGEPSQFKDLKSGEMNWRVEVTNYGKHMGFFYAKGQSLPDGNIPIWFAGSGNSEGKIKSKYQEAPTIKKVISDELGASSGENQSAKLKQAIRQHEKKYQLRPGETVPKGSHKPLKGPVSLIFDPTKFKKVIPANDPNKKELIPENPPQAPTGWQTIKSETFEGSFPNSWNVYAANGYADAYWDDTSYKHHGGSWSGFCADLGSEGTGYGGQYVNNMQAWMVYGPFSLADATDAKVNFWHWTKTETNFDKFHYVASTNGTNFYGYYLTGNMTDDAGNVNGWLSQTFDLTNVYQIGDLTGQSQVWIAFVFTSDASIIDDGAYLDDVYIKKNVGSETPTLTDHFTCRDGNDPYNTQTSVFDVTDNMVVEFTKWNSSSCTSTHSLDVKFYDTSDSYYWGGSTNIPAGNSSWTWWAGIYISGHDPANDPGQWKARIFVDGSQVAHDNFTIQQQGGEPQLNAHFMCSDGDDPYNTRADTFYTTDNLATLYTKWNTNSCTRDWTANISFYDTNDDFYAGLDFNLPQGNSNYSHWVGIYIAGHDPANDPGQWIARVHLEGTWKSRDDFMIIQQQQQEPTISVVPTSLDIYQTLRRAPDNENAPPDDYIPPDGRYPRGLKIPDPVKNYWKSHSPNFDYDPNQLLSSVDWSANDSPIKNQLQCGSCWAFAAIALVENLGIWDDLSEQELVSCAPGDCNGGWYWDALEYIHNQGVSPEPCHPYGGTNGNCNDKCNSPDYLVKVTNYTPAQGLWGEPANVSDIKAQLQNGPLAVAMLVPDDGTFDSYSGGVYNYNGGSLSWDNGHAVLIVGYNDNGQYFKAKNSWGPSWGENGYFRIAYDDVTDDVHFGMYACTASGVYQEGGNSGNTFVIQNTGTANLIVSSITDNKSWLTFSPTTIPTLSPGASQTVTVTITNWSAVNCPTETGTISIHSNDPQHATVQVAVTAHPQCNNNPILVVNPTSMTFSSNQGSNPPSQTFAISNGGGGSFSWTVSDNKSWMSCNPTSGSTTSETDNVTVSVNSSGLTPGQTYTGAITVTASGAGGSPKTVNVTFNYGGGGPCNPPYVKAEDASGAQGSNVVVDVTIAQNPSAIDAFGFKFTFNASKLSFVSVEKGNLTSGFDFFNGQESPTGTVTIGGFDTTPIPANSSGTIARVTLHVNQCSEGESVTLGIQNLTDDLSGMNPCDGTFTCQSCLLGDVNNDGTISPGDALCAFQIYLNGGNLPSGDCNNECALYAADINCTPNGITPGDALYIFQGYLNGDSAPLDCDPSFALQKETSQPREISLIQLSADQPGEIKLAVRLSQVQGLQAFGLNVGFSDDILQLVAVNSSPLTQLWESFGGKESISGVVTVGGFHSEAVQRKNPAVLAELTFRVLKEADAAELWLYDLTDDLKDASLAAETIHVPLTTTDVHRVDANGVPQKFSLSQNYPNPFNMETDIEYELPEAIQATLTVYNAMGQKVRTLVSQKQDAGRYVAHWDGKDAVGNDLPSGIYVYKLQTAKFFDAKKLILVK